LPTTVASAIRENILPDLIAVDILARTLQRRLGHDPDVRDMLQQMSDAMTTHIEGIRSSLRA
jgi:hypothetical protein